MSDGHAITIKAERDEAVQEAMEYADFLATCVKGDKRPPEMLAHMRRRLKVKQAIASRYERLLERQNAQAAGGVS